ncbi:hypothetical protein E1180_02335 [Roseibium denhamense]|uniref:DUF5330 domain-containing protein n=1 Tax=Roseibium denhamense TaxID=76305 RepID=A0ABY1N5R8_9HYPH|nr:DUF5330 domain-containing protein [Roseibium denhamense]MTI04353.1 hypothetical protein [Roseibium denhamense]SMP00972.1 hypothetical protein SAMN06265374_0292 [Roseibium denhamense]
MFFLLRTAFWLTLVLVLIPLGSDKASEPVEQVDPVSAFLAAQATVSDIGSFCDRNPSACEAGGSALNVIGSRARDGARIVYEFLDDQLAPPGDAPEIVTGSTNVLPTADMFAANEDTHSETQTKVSSEETTFGPVPRPKPRLGTSS